jgi:hypothetical protein
VTGPVRRPHFHSRLEPKRLGGDRRGLGKLDGRTKEAKFLNRMREGLIAHVGGSPSLPQRALIERLIHLELRVAIGERDMVVNPERFSAKDDAIYSSLVGKIETLYTKLGIKPTSGATHPSLADVLQGVSAP